MNSSPVARWKALVLAAISAGLLFVAGEPLGIGPLAWVALVPLLYAIFKEDRPLWSWLLGLCFGVVYFGVHLSWIFLFGWMAWVGLTLTMALYTSVATLLAGLVRKAILAPVAVAGAWAGIELVRDRWPYGGYPWGAVGTAQGSVPGVRWLAGVVGVYGLSYLAVFAAALIAARVARGRWDLRAVGVVGCVLLVFVAVDLIGFGRPSSGRPVRVAVVQGGVPRPPRPDQNATILRSHIRITRDLIEEHDPVDLVVWPESAIANSVAEEGIREVKSLAVSMSTPFLVGRSFYTDDAYFNLVDHVTAEGIVAGEYVKRHPVPFGEYVPVGFLRNAVGTLQSNIPVDQRPGRVATVFDVEGRMCAAHTKRGGSGGRSAPGIKIADPICFESVFPRDFLDYVRKGAELFVVSTYNSSFERSYASQQHHAHGRMRALETRQWVVQAALAGISGVMGPDGSLSNTTKLFTAEGFVAEVRARKAQSLYAKTGDVFPAAGGVFTGACLILAVLRRRDRKLESSA